MNELRACWQFASCERKEAYRFRDDILSGCMCSNRDRLVARTGVERIELPLISSGPLYRVVLA